MRTRMTPLIVIQTLSQQKTKWTFGRSWRSRAEIQDTLFIVSPVVQL